jgi:soluble lytic murein transglycosylase-like protein
VFDQQADPLRLDTLRSATAESGVRSRLAVATEEGERRRLDALSSQEVDRATISNATVDNVVLRDFQTTLSNQQKLIQNEQVLARDRVSAQGFGQAQAIDSAAIRRQAVAAGVDISKIPDPEKNILAAAEELARLSPREQELFAPAFATIQTQLIQQLQDRLRGFETAQNSPAPQVNQTAPSSAPQAIAPASQATPVFDPTRLQQAVSDVAPLAAAEQAPTPRTPAPQAAPTPETPFAINSEPLAASTAVAPVATNILDAAARPTAADRPTFAGVRFAPGHLFTVGEGSTVESLTSIFENADEADLIPAAEEEREFESAATAPEYYPKVEDTSEGYRGGEANAVFNAMIFRESTGKQFDKRGRPLTSSAGAVGIAQVMPATARHVATQLLREPFDEQRYRNDAAYNQRLGQTYFNSMLKTFGGDTTLAAAAYNAGPGNVRKWLRTIGDPRKGQVSHAAWVSQIRSGPNPTETRDYVRAVMGRALRDRKNR